MQRSDKNQSGFLEDDLVLEQPRLQWKEWGQGWGADWEVKWQEDRGSREWLDVPKEQDIKKSILSLKSRFLLPFYNRKHKVIRRRFGVIHVCSNSESAGPVFLLHWYFKLLVFTNTFQNNLGRFSQSPTLFCFFVQDYSQTLYKTVNIKTPFSFVKINTIKYDTILDD